jgi:TonB-dependent SusC/RagA subfamily outer membrane receptor
MLPIAYYLLKVIICSGILLGYYWLALRNKIFHHYNRFYLLAAVVLSLSLPAIKIGFWENTAAEKPGVIKVLQAVSNGDVYLDNIIVSNTAQHWYAPQWDAMQWAAAAYVLVAISMLLALFHTLFIIYRLLKKYPQQKIGAISFVNTEAKSTPFSFLNYIFWNRHIDAESATGKQIFKHEVAHIQEKHTHDKLFMNAVLAVCWCNPFFWLIRRELNMIHEFIADKKAVEDCDTAAFAAMILQATYPQHRFQLTNNFFYSPIKRRLAMLVKNNNSKVTYFGRILVLPLAVLVFAAFTFKVKNSNKTEKDEKSASAFSAKQSIAQIIAALPDDTTKKEKQKKIKALINEETYFISADSFVFASNIPTGSMQHSEILMIVNGKEFDYKTRPGLMIKARMVKGYGKNDAAAVKRYGSKASNGVLEFYDAAMEEPAEVTTTPLAKITESGTENVLLIINGKEAGTGKAALARVDEKQIDHMSVLKGETAVEKYGTKGTNGVIEITTKGENELPDVLYVVDGIVREKEYVNSISPDQIQKMDVLKDASAVSLYGEKAKKGVIVITTKPAASQLDEVVVMGYPSEKAKQYNQTAPAAIALDKMNVLYIGVDNPITAAAPGVAPEDLVLTVTQGNASITGKNGKYNVRVTTPGQITIGVMKKGENKLISQSSFRVKRIPDPVNGELATDYDAPVLVKQVTEQRPGIDGLYATRMKTDALKKGRKLTAGNGYEVVSATAYFSGAGFPKVISVNITGNDLAQLSEYTSRCNSGSVVTFDNIKAKYRVNEQTVTISGISIALYDDTDNKVFTRVETEATYADGADAWKKYLMKNLDPSIPTKEGWKPGNYTVIVQFVVRADGTVTDVTTTNYGGTKTAQHCINLVKNAGKWKPAVQNGCIVNSYRKQPLTFSLN